MKDEMQLWTIVTFFWEYLSEAAAQTWKENISWRQQQKKNLTVATYAAYVFFLGPSQEAYSPVVLLLCNSTVM